MARENFTVDDIHAIRVETAEEYRHMTKEDADKDFKEQVQNIERLMRSLKGQNAKQ